MVTYDTVPSTYEPFKGWFLQLLLAPFGGMALYYAIAYPLVELGDKTRITENDFYVIWAFLSVASVGLFQFGRWFRNREGEKIIRSISIEEWEQEQNQAQATKADAALRSAKEQAAREAKAAQDQAEREREEQKKREREAYLLAWPSRVARIKTIELMSIAGHDYFFMLPPELFPAAQFGLGFAHPETGNQTMEEMSAFNYRGFGGQKRRFTVTFLDGAIAGNVFVGFTNLRFTQTYDLVGFALDKDGLILQIKSFPRNELFINEDILAEGVFAVRNLSTSRGNLVMTKYDMAFDEVEAKLKLVEKQQDFFYEELKTNQGDIGGPI
jgi:hypothetical protein